jgi:hypothetical protein
MIDAGGAASQDVAAMAGASHHGGLRTAYTL